MRRAWHLFRWLVIAAFLVALGLSMHWWFPPGPCWTVHAEGETDEVDGFAVGEQTWVSLKHGRRFWTNDDDNQLPTPALIHSWDLATGQPRKTYFSDQQTILRRVSTPDKRFWAFDLGTDRYHFIDFLTDKTWTIRCPGDCKEQTLRSISAAPDGSVLAMRTSVFWISLTLFKPGCETPILTVPQMQGHVAFSPDSRYLFYQEHSNTFAWDLHNHRLVGQPAHADGEIRFSPDGKILAIGMRNGFQADTVTLWSYPSLQPLRNLEIPTHLSSRDSLGFEFSPDSRSLASFSGAGGRVRHGILFGRTTRRIEFWDLQSGQATGQFDSDEELFTNGLFSPESSSYALLTQNKKLIVLDLQGNLLCERQTSLSDWETNCFAFSAKGDHIVPTLFTGSHAAILDRTTGKAQANITVSPHSRTLLAFDALDVPRVPAMLNDEPKAQPGPPPGLVETWLGKVFPETFAQATRPLDSAIVLDSSTGQTLAKLNRPNIQGGWLARDGKALVVAHSPDKNQIRYERWDLPMRPRWLLVLGAPGLLACVLYALAKTKARKRGATVQTANERLASRGP
jgi:WD40 repeat protein